MTSEMANISPFAILPYSVYPLFLIIATCITIQAGLLRTAEEKTEKNRQKKAIIKIGFFGKIDKDRKKSALTYRGNDDIIALSLFS